MYGYFREKLHVNLLREFMGWRSSYLICSLFPFFFLSAFSLWLDLYEFFLFLIFVLRFCNWTFVCEFFVFVFLFLSLHKSHLALFFYSLPFEISTLNVYFGLVPMEQDIYCSSFSLSQALLVSSLFLTAISVISIEAFHAVARFCKTKFLFVLLRLNLRKKKKY